MSKQVPDCRKREFNCLDCDDKNECEVWNEILEKEKMREEELLEEMPTIVKFFGVCGLKEGTMKDWERKLEVLAFGC